MVQENESDEWSRTGQRKGKGRHTRRLRDRSLLFPSLLFPPPPPYPVSLLSPLLCDSRIPVPHTHTLLKVRIVAACVVCVPSQKPHRPLHPCTPPPSVNFTANCCVEMLQPQPETTAVRERAHPRGWQRGDLPSGNASWEALTAYERWAVDYLSDTDASSRDNRTRTRRRHRVTTAADRRAPASDLLRVVAPGWTGYYAEQTSDGCVWHCKEVDATLERDSAERWMLSSPEQSHTLVCGDEVSAWATPWAAPASQWSCVQRSGACVPVSYMSVVPQCSLPGIDPAVMAEAGGSVVPPAPPSVSPSGEVVRCAALAQAEQPRASACQATYAAYRRNLRGVRYVPATATEAAEDLGLPMSAAGTALLQPQVVTLAADAAAVIEDAARRGPPKTVVPSAPLPPPPPPPPRATQPPSSRLPYRRALTDDDPRNARFVLAVPAPYGAALVDML